MGPRNILSNLGGLYQDSSYRGLISSFRASDNWQTYNIEVQIGIQGGSLGDVGKEL